jgi:hypothetical protein
MRDGITERITRGDRRAALVALSERLEVALCSAEPGQVAAIARELRAVLTELDAMTGGQEVSKLDELTARRQARIANATGS